MKTLSELGVLPGEKNVKLEMDKEKLDQIINDNKHMINKLSDAIYEAFQVRKVVVFRLSGTTEGAAEVSWVPILE